MKPRLRGVSHQYAFFVAVAAGAALVALVQGLPRRCFEAEGAVSAGRRAAGASR